MSRVMIVEPLPLLRLALRQVLERLGYQLVAEADNGQDALLQARSESPQLVVLELAITGLGGLDLMRRLKLRDSSLQVLVYTTQSPHQFARLCGQAGADGFVSKHDDLLELERALGAVSHGRRYFPRDARGAAVAGGGNELDALSARELTVLGLISEGCSNQAIAEQLAISYKTVSTYKTRLQDKLQVDSRLALANIAQRNGIGTPSMLALTVPAEQNNSHPDANRQALLRAMLEASAKPMFVRDREGRLLMCNQPFLTLHHTSLERVLGQRLDDAFWFTPEQGRWYQSRYEACIEKGESFNAQVVVEFLGEPHYLQFWAEPWLDGNDVVQGMVGSFEDLTDRHVLLGQLRDAHEQAESRYREVTRFARVVYEDLNEPLQRLLTGLGKAILPPAGQAALQRLSGRLHQLEQLLSLEQQHPAQVPTQLDIVAWLEARLATLAVAPALDCTGVSARQLWIDGDRFGELLGTLLQYLNEAVPQTPLTISLATRMQLNGMVTLNLTVVLCQPLVHRQGLALQLCRHLSQSMEGSFRDVRENGETTFLIELESPAALAGSRHGY